MDPAEVEERLESLERVHVFVRRGEEMEFPDGTLTLKYRFVHVLYQNVLYASLQPTRRAALSRQDRRRGGDALRRRRGGDCRQLAVLFETARDFAGSAKYFLHRRAARRRAVRVSRGAVARRARARRTARAARGPRGCSSNSGLQMMRGLALRSVKGWAAPEARIDVRARARAVPAAAAIRRELLPVLWNLEFLQHDPRRSGARARADVDADAPGRSSRGKPAYLMAMHHVAGVTAEFIGDFVESQRAAGAGARTA